MESTLRIVVVHPTADARARWIDALARRLPDAQVYGWSPEGVAEGTVVPARYAVGWMPPAGFFTTQPHLHAFFTASAGVDGLLSHPELPPGLPVIRLEDAGMGQQMLEYCRHEVVRLYRRFADYERQQCDATWAPLSVGPKRAWPIGVFGLGVLGRQVALGLAASGFPVRGYSRTPAVVEGIDCFDERHGLREFLAGTRVLILMAPLTAQTADLFDAQRLAWLSEGSWLINVARGGLVNEPALLDAIASGRLAGATLDVFHDEPLPPGHPFWQHRSIRITPHVAAVTRVEESVRQVADKIGAIERGATVGGVVDRRRGY